MRLRFALWRFSLSITQLGHVQDLLGYAKEMRLPYLRVSLTADCNAGCAFCHNEGQRIGDRQELATIGNAILPISAYRFLATYSKPLTHRVKLTGGEPTLIRNLPEIVNAFAENAFDVSMTTNAWLFDDRMQRVLAGSGLKGVNVSFPSMAEEVYDKSFQRSGFFPSALSNLRSMNEYFPGRVKLNFVAIKALNFPNDVIPLSELSRDIGATVSLLTLVSPSAPRVTPEELVAVLRQHYGSVDVTDLPDDFVDKTIITLPNAGRWEIDDFRREDYRATAFDNQVCRACKVRERCVEGPYALRIDAGGVARPCLIRSDNSVTLKELGYSEATQWQSLHCIS